MAGSERDWPAPAVRLFLAIAERTPDGSPELYAPACWLRQRATPRNRSRWSRWTRRLANAGLIRRFTEPNRDRVRQVAVTPAGRAWINEHCGPGAVNDLNLGWDRLQDLRESPRGQHEPPTGQHRNE